MTTRWKVSKWCDYSGLAAMMGVSVESLEASQPATAFVGYVVAATKGEAILEAYKLDGVTAENMIVDPVRAPADPQPARIGTRGET